METQGERIPEAALRPLPERSPLTQPMRIVADPYTHTAEILLRSDQNLGKLPKIRGDYNARGGKRQCERLLE